MIKLNQKLRHKQYLYNNNYKLLKMIKINQKLKHKYKNYNKIYNLL